jgi:hypothetical protein
MGKFYNAEITATDPQEIAASVSNFFNDLDGITSEVIEYTYNSNTYYTADIKIDGTDIEMYCGCRENLIFLTKLINGDITYLSDATNGHSDPPTTIVSAYINDDCIMLYCYNKIRFTYNGIEVMYVKTSDNKNLIGYYRNTVSANTYNFFDISNLTFEDLDDSARIAHTYTNMFPYEAIAGTIDFLAQSYFVNNGTRKFQSNLLRECSIVTLGSTASLPDGNYIALGAHCLAPLDEEEVE